MIFMSFDTMTDEEIHRRIQKAVEMEREGLKIMGFPLIQWDDELQCVIKLMPNGEKIKIEENKNEVDV